MNTLTLPKWVSLIGLLCIYLTPIYSQNSDIEDQVKLAFSTLDHSELTTGILYESVPEYVPFKLYDGSAPNDSIYADLNTFTFRIYQSYSPSGTG